MDCNKVKFVVEDGGYYPEKEFECSAGYDLRCPRSILVPVGRSIIPLNIKMELPKGYGAFIFSRSGITAKGMQGRDIYSGEVMRYNADVNLGLVDSDYRGVVGVLVNNRSEESFYIDRGWSIAQMVIMKCESPVFEEVERLSESERGKQGFNS